MKSIMLMLVSAEVMLAPIFGAKLLFIPNNAGSHVLFFSRLAADLAQLGHVTRVLAASNARVPQFIGELGSDLEFQLHDVPGRRTGTFYDVWKRVCGYYENGCVAVYLGESHYNQRSGEKAYSITLNLTAFTCWTTNT